MDSIVQAILNLSKLEVSLIRITKPTPTGFTISIESKTTHTGPLPATLAPMTVDLVGPKGPFGKLNLPEVKTTSKGADVNIAEQNITITDMAAFEAYVKALQLDDKLTMHLDNGQGSIKAMGMKSKIVYKKPINMLGMAGPSTKIVKTTVNADGTFTNEIEITNPSPVEIDLGNPKFVFKNAAGVVLAEQSGPIFITRKSATYTATGKVLQKVAAKDLGRVNLAGVGEGNDTWLKASLGFFNSTITLTPELKTLFVE